MKKRIIIGLLATLMIFTLFGCTTKVTVSNEEVSWKIEVIGAESKLITDVQCKNLELVEFTADLKKKDGSIKSQVWKGYKLADVLNLINVEDYTTITVEADDGYNVEYTPEIVEDPETIVGIERDGEERSQPMMVAKNQRGNFWIKNTVKLTVNK